MNVDGIESCYRDVDMDSLRRSMAIVPQDTVLFHNTIKFNINYGNLNATPDQVC